MIPRSAYRYSIRNDAGEPIPPYGIGKLVSVAGSISTGEFIYSLRKPDGKPGIHVVVDGGISLAAGAYGSAVALMDATIVMADPTGSSSTTPSVGEVCGPEKGVWYASKKGSGLYCMSAVQSTMSSRTFLVLPDLIMQYMWVSVIGTVTPPSTPATVVQATCAVLLPNVAGGLDATTGRVLVNIRDSKLALTDGTPMFVVRWLTGLEVVWAMCVSYAPYKNLPVSP